MTSAAYRTQSRTTATALSNTPYIDKNAGGQWNCGNIKGFGAAPSFQWDQTCASCPPCQDNRFAIQLSLRDGQGMDCCTNATSNQNNNSWLCGGNAGPKRHNTNTCTSLSGDIFSERFDSFDLFSEPKPFDLFSERFDSPIPYPYNLSDVEYDISKKRFL